MFNMKLKKTANTYIKEKLSHNLGIKHIFATFYVTVTLTSISKCRSRKYLVNKRVLECMLSIQKDNCFSIERSGTSHFTQDRLVEKLKSKCKACRFNMHLYKPKLQTLLPSSLCPKTIWYLTVSATTPSIL